MYVPSKLKISVNIQTQRERIPTFKMSASCETALFEASVQQIELCMKKGKQMKGIE